MKKNNKKVKSHLVGLCTILGVKPFTNMDEIVSFIVEGGEIDIINGFKKFVEREPPKQSYGGGFYSSIDEGKKE